MGRESGITIKWGPGFEDRKKALDGRAKVRRSLTIALDAMTTLGVPSTGRKVVFVRAPDTSGPKVNLVGGASSSTRMTLYSRAATLAYEDEASVVHDALTLVHEGFHTERMKEYDYTGTIETTVSEGLSYYSEYTLAAIDKQFAALQGPVPKLLKRKPQDIEALGDTYLTIANREEKRKGDSAWLNDPEGSPLSRSEQIGVYLVDNLFTRGAVFKDLIQAPPEIFLGSYEATT